LSALYAASQARNTSSAGRELAAGQGPDLGTNRWHNLKLQFSGTNISALVDGKLLFVAGDASYTNGLAGLVTGGDGNARNSAQFANFIINSVNGPKPPQTRFVQDAYPIYSKKMIPSRVAWTLLFAGLAWLLVASCATSRPDPIATVEAHAADFNEATPAIKNIWDQVVATVNSGDNTAALSALEALGGEPGLTPAQVRAVAHTERAVTTQLRHPPRKSDGAK
jgi:hypothetical protein